MIAEVFETFSGVDEQDASPQTLGLARFAHARSRTRQEFDRFDGFCETKPKSWQFRLQDAPSETSSFGEESGLGEWVLPEVEPDQWAVGETTSDQVNGRSNGSPTTVPGDYRRVSAPIRKDSFLPRFPRDRIKLLQQWECVVSQVHDDCVECEMHDLTDESKPVECAEVLLEAFNEYDRALLCEGTVFYWSVGYKTKRTGQVTQYSNLHVRRMPPLTNLKKREINERAKQLSELLDANS